MTLDEIAKIPPPETQVNHMRNVPQTYAQELIDSEGRPPIYENGSLKLWHIPAIVSGRGFIITVGMSDAGSTLSVATPYGDLLDIVLREEMKNMPIVSHIKH